MNEVLTARNKLAMKSVVEFPQNTRFRLIPRSIFHLSLNIACLRPAAAASLNWSLCVAHSRPLHIRSTKTPTWRRYRQCWNPMDDTLCLFWRSVRRQSDMQLQSTGSKCANLCPPWAPLVEWSNKNMRVLYCIRVSFEIITLNMKLESNQTGNVRMT